MKVLKLFTVILVLSVSSYSYAGSNIDQFSSDKGKRNIQTQQLTAQEQESLLYIREEEKLARDVYLTLYEFFEANIFNNIASAEQKHMDSMKDLLTRFALKDPVLDDSIGAFTNPVFSEYYESKTGKVRTIKDAILTGILIEETDIMDIQKNIVLTDNPDIQNIYENLLRGSRNHLRAFVSKLEAMGVVYEALVLNQATADAIVNSPVERGSSKRRGRGEKERQWN